MNLAQSDLEMILNYINKYLTTILLTKTVVGLLNFHMNEMLRIRREKYVGKDLTCKLN